MLFACLPASNRLPVKPYRQWSAGERARLELALEEEDEIKTKEARDDVRIRK